MVKRIFIVLEDKEHAKLKEKKGKLSWYNFLIKPHLNKGGGEK
jgi:hypothetical protein